MSGKKRTTVSLEEGIIAKAQAMMKGEDFGDFSGFLEQIIRERWQHRQADAAAILNDAPAKATRHSQPVNYHKKKFGKG